MESEDSVGATDLARRLQRDAHRDGIGKRQWAGWELELTLQQPTAEPSGEWRLSVNWVGGYPIEAGRARLKVLIVVLGVPKMHHDVVDKVSQYNPHVVHWVWREVE